jgi:DNA-binding FadR family transcriptional regulator
MTLPAGIAHQVRSRILLHEIRAGTKLESCRAMAREVSVSIAVVREAIAQLRGEGFVQVRHGVGVFVAARPHKARAFKAAYRGARSREVMELRAALEPIAAEAATSRGTDATQLDLRMLLGERELARREGNARLFAEADVAFHRAVFRMSGNRLAAAGVELAGPVMLRHLATDAIVIAADDHLQALHARLTDAIEMGRPSQARRAARAIAAREGAGAFRPP